MLQLSFFFVFFLKRNWEWENEKKKNCKNQTMEMSKEFWLLEETATFSANYNLSQWNCWRFLFDVRDFGAFFHSDRYFYTVVMAKARLLRSFVSVFFSSVHVIHFVQKICTKDSQSLPLSMSKASIDESRENEWTWKGLRFSFWLFCIAWFMFLSAIRRKSQNVLRENNRTEWKPEALNQLKLSHIHRVTESQCK